MMFYIHVVACLFTLQLSGCNSANEQTRKDLYTDTDSLLSDVLRNKTSKLSLPAKFLVGDSLNIRGLSTRDYVDNAFLHKYICDYDNFCEQNYSIICEHAYDKSLRISDSICVISIVEFSDITKSKILLLSFNTNRSSNPVDKLVVSGFYNGKYQLESFIDSSFTISMFHILSSKGYTKHPLGKPDSLSNVMLVHRRYRLNEAGYFEPTVYLEGYIKSIQNKNQHFKIVNNSEIYVHETWRLDEYGFRVDETSKYHKEIRDEKLFININKDGYIISSINNE